MKTTKLNQEQREQMHQDILILLAKNTTYPRNIPEIAKKYGVARQDVYRKVGSMKNPNKQKKLIQKLMRRKPKKRRLFTETLNQALGSTLQVADY